MNFWHPDTKNEIETDWGCCCTAWAITCLQGLNSTHTSSEDTYTTCQNSILFFCSRLLCDEADKSLLSLSFTKIRLNESTQKKNVHSAAGEHSTHTTQGGSGAEAAEKSHTHTHTGTCLHFYEGLSRQAKFCNNISYT